MLDPGQVTSSRSCRRTAPAVASAGAKNIASELIACFSTRSLAGWASTQSIGPRCKVAVTAADLVTTGLGDHDDVPGLATCGRRR